MQDELFRYTVSLYDGALIRFTAFNNAGEILEETEFSENNSIDMPQINSNWKLQYEITSKQENSFTYDQPQTFTFLKGPKSPLGGYDASDMDIQWTDHTVTITNQFDEVPVQYAWYVIYEGKPIIKQMYEEATSVFEYTFIKPGKYQIKAYAKTKDNKETKSVYALILTMDSNGTIQQK